MASVATPAMTRDALVERVGTLPRVPIAALPTPLEEMPRLRAALGPDVPRLFVKRDDLTGLAFGGNKVRHLEFRVADVLAKGADGEEALEFVLFGKNAMEIPRLYFDPEAKSASYRQLRHAYQQAGT